MKLSVLQQKTIRVCVRCGKGPIASRARSHSMRSTNRTVWKNLQQTNRGLVCAKCLKSDKFVV